MHCRGWSARLQVSCTCPVAVGEDSDMKAWKRRAKLKNMESRRKHDVPTYDITNAAARRRELDRVKKEKQKSKGSLRYKKAV